MTVTGADTVGQDAFDMGILVKNTGQVSTDSSLQITSSTGTVADLGKFTLRPGETKYISQSYEINQDTNFDIKMTGDVTKTITKAVKFGCVGSVIFAPAPVYPSSTDERKEIWEVPITISNQGAADLRLGLLFTLNAVSGNWSKETGISYYVPSSATIQDNLVFDGVPKGDYVLSYASDLLSGTAIVKVADFNVGVKV